MQWNVNQQTSYVDTLPMNFAKHENNEICSFIFLILFYVCHCNHLHYGSLSIYTLKISSKDLKQLDFVFSSCIYAPLKVKNLVWHISSFFVFLCLKLISYCMCLELISFCSCYIETSYIKASLSSLKHECTNLNL